MADDFNSTRPPEGAPRGVRGAGDPQSGFHVGGINDRLFSQQQIDAMARQAEEDKRWEATQAYAPANCPIITRQLNPLLIPNDAQDWPEFWTVYVPRTTVAWERRDLERDWLHRTPTHLLHNAPGAVEGDSDIGFFAEQQEKERLQAHRQDTAGLQDHLAHQDRRAFPSADEAERFAQQVWRTYWSEQIPKMPAEVRKDFAQNRAIRVVRREEFTWDTHNPAHVLQHDVWRAQYAESGLPNGVVVREQHANLAAYRQLSKPSDERTITLEALAESFIEDPRRFEWIPQERTESIAREDAPWQAHAIGERLWLLARPLTDPPQVNQWELWRNGTGLPLAFDAKSLETVQKAVPRSLTVVSGETGPGVPTASQWNELWDAARQHPSTPDPTLQTWLSAGEMLGKPIRLLVASNPTAARQLQPTMQAIAAVYHGVVPVNGVLPSSAAHLDALHDNLDTVIERSLPPGTLRDKLQHRAQYWHQQAENLNQDHLGLFQKGRVADVAFADSTVENGPRLNGTSDWVAMRLPSHRYIAGRVDRYGRIVQADAVLYHNPEAVRIRAASQGGYVSWQASETLVDAWTKAVERTLKEAAPKRIQEGLTPASTEKRVRAQAKQDVDPQPVPKPDPVPPQTLYITPLGAHRGVIWRYPDDGRRKDLDPEFVAWRQGELVPLNKHAKDWMPKPRPGDPPRDYARLAPGRKPWIVEAPGGLDGLVAAAQSRVPTATVEPALLTHAPMIRALAERYNVQPVGLSADEALWVVHPTPTGQAMISTRQWTVHEKPDYPGEYVAEAVAQPYWERAADGSRQIKLWPTVARAQTDLDRLASQGVRYETRSTFPPEITEWFIPKITRITLDAPAVRWGPIDPWTALMQRGSRFHRECFLADLEEAQQEAGIREPVRLMQKRVVSGARPGLDAPKLAAIFPDLAQEAGVSWDVVERNVHDYAKHWLGQNPRLAERLTQRRPDAPRPARLKTTPALS